LTCSKALFNVPACGAANVTVASVPACASSGGASLENAKQVSLSWMAPSFGQTRNYTVLRAIGSFPTSQLVLANLVAFAALKPSLTGTPPASSCADTNVKNGVTYTYIVADGNKQGVQSGGSNPIVVKVKF
jgi:hypothetical protein